MKVSNNIANKLLQLAGGEELPASSFTGPVIKELIDDGIVQERIQGRTKRMLYISDPTALHNWLAQKHGINNLEAYVNTEAGSRADNIILASNSKYTRIRTFTGFLINTSAPVVCTLNNEPFIVDCRQGTFLFLSRYKAFVPPADATIVGIENAEVFSNVHKLQHLFPGNTLFVCRYPQHQSKDLMEWLQQIPNNYIHLGDYDLSGINIFLQEYKRHLGERASFFVPGNIEELLQRYGNSQLYDSQKLNTAALRDGSVQGLIALLHKYKKGLEQEVLLRV